MLKRQVLLCALALMVAGVSACIFDPKSEPPVVPPTNPLKDLTHKEDVLNNIEAAYNQHRIDWYDGLLDVNFIFFLSSGDVGGGLPESWDRAEEIAVNKNLFNRNYTVFPPGPCSSIIMDIRTEDGLTWQESTHTPVSGPDEIWYTATLHYEFKFEIAPNTYENNPGAQADFTVRDAGPKGKYAHHWQLVEFRDRGSQ